jgi:tetratricopeptide (TPR) repeat protein
MSSETSNNSMGNSAGPADACIDAMIDDVARMMERDPHTARSTAADALALAEQSTNSRLVARALRAVGNTLFFTGENESALQHIEQSYRVSEAIDFTSGMIESLLSRSNIYASMGCQTEAIAAATQGIELCRATGNNIAIAKLRNTLALVYSHTGNYQAALNLHLENINLRTQIGDTEQLAVSLGNIASIYLYFNDLDLCLDANLRALEAYRILGTNRLGEATTLFNLCNCLIHRGDYDAAWARCDELQRILGDTGPAGYRVRMLQMRATLLGFRDEYEPALALIISALKLA